MDNKNNEQQDIYAIPDGTVVRTVLTNRKKVLIAAIVFVMALGYLFFNAFQGSTAYYLTVSELVTEKSAFNEKNVRVNGKLVPSSFEREQDGVSLSFSLTDGSNTISATHMGIVPDLFFNEHSEILLEGVYRPDTPFDAEAIIVKCPSKYQSASDTT